MFIYRLQNFFINANLIPFTIYIGAKLLTFMFQMNITKDDRNIKHE